MDGADQRVLAACERIEVLAAQAYRKLAALHAADTELAALWSKTAREEESHAAQFRFSQAVLDQVVGQVRVKLADAVTATNRLVDFLRRCDASPPSSLEALREMIDLEQWLEQFHLANAAAFTSPQHQKLFRAMMQADCEHVGALRAVLARRTSNA
jgi:rubrerythrin